VSIYALLTRSKKVDMRKRVNFFRYCVFTTLISNYVPNLIGEEKEKRH